MLRRATLLIITLMLFLAFNRVIEVGIIPYCTTRRSGWRCVVPLVSQFRHLNSCFGWVHRSSWRRRRKLQSSCCFISTSLGKNGRSSLNRKLENLTATISKRAVFEGAVFACSTEGDDGSYDFRSTNPDHVRNRYWLGNHATNCIAPMIGGMVTATLLTSVRYSFDLCDLETAGATQGQP